MQIMGIKALIEIIVQFAFVWLSFAAIQGMHFERFFNLPPRTLPLLIVLLATGLGYLCATFFLSILSAIGNLTYLIR